MFSQIVWSLNVFWRVCCFAHVLQNGSGSAQVLQKCVARTFSLSCKQGPHSTLCACSLLKLKDKDKLLIICTCNTKATLINISILICKYYLFAKIIKSYLQNKIIKLLLLSKSLFCLNSFKDSLRQWKKWGFFTCDGLNMIGVFKPFEIIFHTDYLS